MTRGSDLGRSVRRRRVDLGVSRTNVAEAVGVSPLMVGRWERGEVVPSPDQARALADVLDAGAGTVEEWLSMASAAHHTNQDAGGPGSADPWSMPPEKRITPPRIDRRALLGRTPDDSSDGGGGVGIRDRDGGNSVEPDSPQPVPLGGLPASALERVLRRQARWDERRVRRELQAADREKRALEVVEERLQEIRRAESARRSAGAARLLPAVPVPAGAANTGTVFPVPDTRKGSETVTYRGLGDHVPEDRDRFTYAIRRIGTVAILVALGTMLWWAVGSLGDGFGAVIDLLRGGEDVPMAPAVTGFIGFG